MPSWGLRDRANVSFSHPLTRGGFLAVDYREFMNFASWLGNIASEDYQRFKCRYVSGPLTMCSVWLEGIRPAPPVFTLRAVQCDVHWRRASGLHTILRRNLSQHSRMNPWFTHFCGSASFAHAGSGENDAFALVEQYVVPVWWFRRAHIVEC